jgi:hypothetical protein
MTPENSVEALTARAKQTLHLGTYAPTRKSNRKDRPVTTVPSFLTNRPPSGGLAYGYYPSKEAQRQTLFELDMLTAFETFEKDNELINYLEEEIVKRPASKRLKIEEPQ